MRIITSYNGIQLKNPIKCWCRDVQENTLEQTVNVANHPGVTHPVILLPDCHLGMGIPIGCVAVTDNVIIPNAVGSDIGCGMRAVKTSLKYDNHFMSIIENIIGRIKNKVPVGLNWHQTPQSNDLVLPGEMYHITSKYEDKIDYQIGTLGSGNHFIEIQKDEDNNIWFMLHSGSRNIGKKICDYYNDIAKKLNKLWHSGLDPSWNLAFLPIGTPEARSYIGEMKIAIDMALENRKVISNQIKKSFLEVIPDITFYDDIDVKHNYAACEKFGNNRRWVYRKGAIKIEKDDMGIIPGNMGSHSYIVAGKGSDSSYNSCSHGAGRKMGRMEASRTLTKEECDEAMQNVGFDGWKTNKKGDLDFGEAPGAYKDIDRVIEEQLDLVTPVVKLYPLRAIKG